MRIFLLNLFILIVYVSYAQEEILKTEPVYIISEVSKNKDEKKDDYTIYRVYAFGISVGEVYFSIKDGKIEARGQTYKKLRFLYSYDFVYIDQQDYKALYEKEKDKEKIYQNEEIYDKKPWLPIIAMFFRGGIDEQNILNLKISINNSPVVIKKTEDEYQKIFYFIPLESKTKKITIFIKKNENLPYRIDIEGKTDISLERVTQQ